jgi:hypothetical protein
VCLAGYVTPNNVSKADGGGVGLEVNHGYRELPEQCEKK